MMPRPASEQLVDATRTHVGDRAARVADVGTGSGAVAIAIALACPDAVVWATDVSASAVRLARANVRVHELAGRVHVCQGDLLASVPGRFDVIAANLPYLPASAASDYPELADEPFDAVFAAGDGLASYRRLVGRRREPPRRQRPRHPPARPPAGRRQGGGVAGARGRARPGRNERVRAGNGARGDRPRGGVSPRTPSSLTARQPASRSWYRSGREPIGRGATHCESSPHSGQCTGGLRAMIP